MPSITFLGAAKTVTGSSFFVEDGDVKFLVDHGMFQSEKEERNLAEYPFNPADIPVLLLTHAHLDHCGLIPRLVRDGFKGTIYATRATMELAEIVMRDSAHIQEENYQEAKQHGEYYEMLYDSRDVDATLALFKEWYYDTPLKIADTCTILFVQAGHLLGSSSIRAEFHNYDGMKILFSGDLGQPEGSLLPIYAFNQQADYVLIESTYGDRNHGPREQRLVKLAKAVNDAVSSKGVLLIPTFTIQRCQEVIFDLRELFEAKKIPLTAVYIDSPMAEKATRVFEKHIELLSPEIQNRLVRHKNPFMYPGMQFVRSRKDSLTIRNRIRPAVILASNGMASAGRIIDHLKFFLEREECHVCFVGYQAPETLGRALVEGAKHVEVEGLELDVNARVSRIEEYSAHADQTSLLDWMRHFKVPPKKIFLIHGEEGVDLVFKEKIEKELQYEVHIPDYGEKIELV